ncbi:succinate dehydrogenase iron-sulfur subunit [candidate division KSB3 bacterium]|uniref:Fumarate reductase iron-sulfur subunit n=1 Tax=candidate division KSB3 bacterium TaxID=2044937 RepID=A0A9D5JXM8_9BACT|nr:succinate dehydrogenase iron-sulfur subunit [candidate division KSB3 bacterium]MBD3325586.1 succinate dehydrogenase iron-sulfur subunit [candidate division KSB3 bacterium]
MIMTDTVQFRVKRSDPATGRSEFQEYQFPYRRGMTILDGLWYIIDHLDGSLGFRYSCRGSVCGSCAMQVNGDIRLACETQISTLPPGVITLEPLGHMTIIRDLIVDMEPFFAKFQAIKPYLELLHDHERENLQSAQERQQIKDAVNCILCASCYAACPITWHHEDYLGPAALSASQRFVFDSRNDNSGERLRQMNAREGVDGCKKISRCTEVCPKHVAPSDRIQELKDLIKEKSAKGTL